MEIKNENYQVFMNHPVGEIPRDELAEIISELMGHAMFYMSSSLDDHTTKTTQNGIILLLKDKFSFLPLHVVGEAFISGSLGYLGGTTRFTIRNVSQWLNAVKESYYKSRIQEKSREDHLRRIEEEKKWKEQHAGDAIFGTALYLKLSWVFSGHMSPDLWDGYTLDSIVTALRGGHTEKTLKPSMITR